MFFAIWYNLYNLKNVKNASGEVLLLVQLATLLIVRILQGCFSLFLICAYGIKSSKAFRIKSIVISAKNNFLSWLIQLQGRTSRKKQGPNLNVSRTAQENDISTKIIKVSEEYSYISYNQLRLNDFLKLGDVSSIFKKVQRSLKSNHKVAYVLPDVLTLFETDVKCFWQYIFEISMWIFSRF